MSEVPCSVCGHPLTVGAQFCSECGTRFEVAPHSVGTLASADPAPPAPAPPPPSASFAKGTMIGMNAADVLPPHLRAQALAPPTAPEQAPAASAPTSERLATPRMGTAPALDAPPASHALPSAAKTMVGVAFPGIAPVAPPEPLPNSNSGAQRAGASATMLGVAIPGIAPTAPPTATAPVAQPPVPKQAPLMRTAVMQAPVIPAPPPLAFAEPAPRAPTFAKPKGVPLALVASLVGGLVLIGGALIAFLWKGAPALTAKPTLDSKGVEQLEITCAKCDDADQVSLGATSAHFASGVATVPIESKLAVGMNAFDVTIVRGSKRNVVHIEVPLAYRVHADVAEVATDTPRVVLRVAAQPGAVVTLDGTPLALDANGAGSRAYDIANETNGQNAEIAFVERSAKYEVTLPGRAVERGTVSAKVPVTPMVVFRPLPHAHVVTGTTADVSGSTAKGATLTIAGKDVPVDASGRFRASLDIAEGGDAEIVVRARAQNHATRTARFVLRRVSGAPALAKASQEFASSAKLRVDDLVTSPATHVGEPVVLRGAVLESRSLGERSVALLRDVTGCTKKPCLVRVVMGTTVALDANAHVAVYGIVSGAFDSPSGSVPEVEADWVLPNGAVRR